MKYISGTYFKKRCKYSVGQYESAYVPRFTFDTQEGVFNKYVFVKAEYLWNNIHAVNSLDGFVLLSHNSDIVITQKLAQSVLELYPNLVHWYAQNLAYAHPQISPLPIGIANPKWTHGNDNTFDKIRLEKNSKKELVYSNFNVATNPVERQYCLSQIDKCVSTSYPQYTDLKAQNEFFANTHENYLRDMSQTYFVISPNGNGIDCHKTWEALYMNSIPIVTRSEMTDRFKEMGIPLIVLDDWSKYRNLDLSENLYHKVWGDFDPEQLSWEFFI